MSIKKNKKAWIKIIEAVIGVLAIIGVLLILINKGYFSESDVSLEIYEKEVALLREIELNNSLRNDILNSVGLPINWEDFSSAGLGRVKDKITAKAPNYLECKAKLCKMNDVCVLDDVIEKDVYVQSVAITSNLQNFNLRQLNLFCWRR